MRAISFIVFTVTLLLAMVVGDPGISHALTAMLNEHQFEAMLVAVIIEPLVVGTTDAWKMLGISPTYGWELLNADELESFLDGKKRKIVVASIHAYIQRKITESKKETGSCRTEKATAASIKARQEKAKAKALEDGTSPPPANTSKQPEAE